MVEGLLLQVSVPEIPSLYYILLNGLRTQHTGGNMLSQDDPSECDNHKQCKSQGRNQPQNEVSERAEKLVYGTLYTVYLCQRHYLESSAVSL